MIDHGSAVAGRCACGARIVRSETVGGSLLTVDPAPVDAAAELRARMDGRRSYVLALGAGVGTRMTLAERTAADIKKKPAGFTRDRIVLAHVCRLTRRDDR